MHDGLPALHGERTTLDLPLEVKADGAPGTFEGYGAVFGNTDRDGDVVAKGAFAESLKARLPALLWQHNAKEPIGRFDVVREDERGLYVRGRLSMTGKGAEAYELLKMGALNGLSIGFVTKEAMRNRATGTRTINRADLMEVSLVTFPANELARVSTVKSEKTLSTIDTPRDFERMLREKGFSRARAKAITAKGFRASGHDGEDFIAGLVHKLSSKQGTLIVEHKNFGVLRTNASQRWTSNWEILGQINPTGPSRFTIEAKSWNDRRITAPFELKVKYVDRNKRVQIRPWLSHGGAAGNGPYLVSEGMQTIQIKAKSSSIPQRIVVWLRK